MLGIFDKKHMNSAESNWYLVTDISEVDHPQVTGYDFVYRNADDVKYRQVVDWMNNWPPGGWIIRVPASVPSVAQSEQSAAPSDAHNCPIVRRPSCAGRPSPGGPRLLV